jgi:hypothetical protein
MIQGIYDYRMQSFQQQLNVVSTVLPPEGQALTQVGFSLSCSVCPERLPSGELQGNHP